MPRNLVRKSIGGAMLSALMITASADRADADLHGLVAGVIVKCVLGGCDNGRANGGNGGGGRVVPKISQAQRQNNRDVQTALNAFDFNAGPADGVPGRKTRSAISAYQAYMGYNPSGQLTQFERETLFTAWQGFRAGSTYKYPNTVRQEGHRALLKIERDPAYAGRYGDLGGAVPPKPPITPYQNLGGGNGPKTEAPGPIIIAKKKGASKSLAAHCELVATTTQIQGGVILSNAMSDPAQALDEKLCEARGFAISEGQTVLAEYAVSDTEMQGICEVIQRAYSPVLSKVATAPMEAITPMATNARNELGLSQAEITRDYGRICLGMGYRLDSADMALASALMLTAAGHHAYGEMVGHHLRGGFGAEQSTQAAMPWYSRAMTALENGATPAFAPSTTSERVNLIRSAAQIVEARADADTVPANATWAVKN